MRTISYTEARQNLSATMVQTVEDRVPTLITRQNGEACVLMSLEEYKRAGGNGLPAALAGQRAPPDGFD